MNQVILLEINHVIHEIDLATPKIYSIKETDELFFAIKANEGMSPPIFQFEDYEITADILDRDGEAFFQIPTKTYFSECFGCAVVRVCFDIIVYEIVFDVFVKKTTADQALKMIKYLGNISSSLIKSCLARTALAVGAKPSEQVEPEALLTAAETILTTLQTYRHELMANYKERLVPIKLPRSRSAVTCEIDPMELLSNLDSLSPAVGIGDVVLRGRNFDLGDIEVSAIHPTADVFENRVLLGSLYSIRRKLDCLQQLLEDLPVNTSGNLVGYESFSRLMLSVTADGMLQRCTTISRQIEGFIRLFEGRLGVTYVGELTPVMTPFVRSTRIYRSLYGQIADWYAMGVPVIGGVQFMMKLKSLSKIYEIFTFYHLLEEILLRGWKLVSAIPHPDFGEYMPCSVTFNMNDENLTVDYEPKIKRLSTDTKNMELIDVVHSANAQYPFWTPDFVLRWDAFGFVRYIILDAKYSNSNSVRKYAIPDLYEKYYEGTAVYDSFNKVALSSPITAVLAVFAIDDRSSNYISKWPYQGIFSPTPRLPAIGGVGLMLDNSEYFSLCLARLFELSRITISSK